MQSRRHSQWEVGIDFGISIVINMGAQAIFLRSFTLSRGLSFSVVFLLLSLLRRYGVRRLFNRWVTSGGQSQGMSLVESITDTVIAILMALILMTVWYPTESVSLVSTVVLVAYTLALLRRYVLRRVFEWFGRRSEPQLFEEP